MHVWVWGRSNWTASVTEEKVGGSLPQYHVDKQFADRRYKVQSARTYFYLNEATCERNMEIFQNCLDAVAGKIYKTIYLNRLTLGEILKYSQQSNNYIVIQSFYT